MIWTWAVEAAANAVRRELDNVEALTDYSEREAMEICRDVARVALDAARGAVLTDDDRAILLEALHVAHMDACSWGEYGGDHDHDADYKRLIVALGGDEH